MDHPEARTPRSRFEELIRRTGSRPLVIAHRGTPLGSFADNTIGALLGAVRSGADVVETDVIASLDGRFHLFHDGFEGKHFAPDVDLRELPAGDIARLQFRWQGGPGGPAVPLLEDLFVALPETWVFVDRSWTHWPGILDQLAPHAHRILLKSPPRPEALAALAAHPVPFLHVPVVRTQEELARVEQVDGIDIAGVEILARYRTDEFADPAAILRLRERYPLVVINAINLENGVPLFLGLDDAVSVLEGPGAGWGALVDLGATAIQTDWVHLLRRYLDERATAEPS